MSNLAQKLNRLALAVKRLFTELSHKVDIVDFNPLWKGVHSSEFALNNEHPTAAAGSYALVDAGAGADAIFYWFDLDDGWITNGDSVSLSSTDALVEGTTNLYFTSARAISAVTATINAAVAASSNNLGIQSNAEHMIFFDDFLNVEITKTYATTVSGVDEIPISTASAAALNWIGGIRVFDSTNGGYFRANCPNKTSGSLFNFLEQNNAIDFTTEIYIPATAEAPTTSGNYFVGIVANHPSDVGLTGAIALVVWDVNSANWRLRLANGTFIDTGVMASKGTKFKIEVRQASDTVLVKINGTTVVAATANSISESAVLPCCGFTHAGTTSVTYEIWQDYHGLKLTLNSSRTNFGFS